MNNSLYDSKIISMKNVYQEKIKNILSEVNNNEYILSASIKTKYLDLIENFSLDNLSSFNIFNDVVIRNLNIMNLYLVKPGYLDLNSSLITNMSDMLSLYSLIFIVAFALFLASVLLFYFFDWRPFQNNLDSTVKYI